MKRSILLSLMVIGTAVMLVAGASLAWFTDSETSTGNTAQAGIMDLKVWDGVSYVDNPNVPAVVDVSDLKPSEVQYAGPIWLKNAGENPGIKDIHFDNVVDDRGIDSDAECDAEEGTWRPDLTPPCRNRQNPADNISTHIMVDICWDWSGDTVVMPDECVDIGKLDAIESTCYNIDEIGPGEEQQIYLSFHLQPEAGNRYQGDRSTFDIAFTLHQVGDTTECVEIEEPT